MSGRKHVRSRFAPLVALAVILFLFSHCFTDFSGGREPRDSSVAPDAPIDVDGARRPDAADLPDAAVQPDAAEPDGGPQPVARASCLAHLQAGQTVSGVYPIDPDGNTNPRPPFDVICDMDTDGGGWTILAHNHNGDQEVSGCIPRLATEASLTCGDVTAGFGADFSLPAWEIPFNEMVWAAYDVNGQVVAYRAFLWNTEFVLPNQALWSLTADDNEHTITDFGTAPKIACDWFGTNTLTSVYNGTPRMNNAYSTTDVLTFFDEDTDTGNPGKMTFTENDAAEGSPYGLDDFQDGWGCGDNWSPQQHRGSSAFIMIR